VEACKQLFKNKGMRTFADWLRYYNDLDVVPGLQALQKMRTFYAENGIDILKDAVSLPGVSMHYLLRGTIEEGAELYSPGKEAYDMLKRGADWRAKPGAQTVPRGRPDNHPLAPFQTAKTLQENHWLRRQRAVSIDDAA